LRKLIRVSYVFWILFLAVACFPLGQPQTVNATSSISKLSHGVSNSRYDLQKTPQEIKIIVILAEFSDIIHNVSRETIEQQVFTQVRDYYREASYGNVSIAGSVTKDWIKLATKFSTYEGLGTFPPNWGDCYELAKDAIKAADNEVDFRKYDKVVIVLPSVRMVNYTLRDPILTSDGCSMSWVTVQQENVGAMVLAHELGHSIGLPDFYDYSKAEYHNFDISPYVGPWCLMSYGRMTGNPVHFCAFSKITLGWISDNQIKVVHPGATEFITLEPLEMEAKGTQVIKIPGHGETYYLVEARRKIGFDSALPDEGILITRVDESEAVRGSQAGGYLLVSGPRGFVQVQDAEPDTSSLNDATFDARPGKKNVFTELKAGLGIVVVDSGNDVYQICVTTADSANKMSKVIDAISQTKFEVNRLEFDSPEAQSYIKEADHGFSSAIELLKTKDYEEAMKEAGAITSKLDKAMSIENSYTEASQFLAKTEDAIRKAESEVRNSGLDEAKDLISQAKSKLDTYDYDGALILSAKAKKTAELATERSILAQNYGLYAGIALVITAGAGAGIWLAAKRKKKGVDGKE
jgi:M6 family metalloprotease-like protein